MNQNKDIPNVFYEKPANDPTSHVYYQIQCKDWEGGCAGSISQGVNNYIFNNPWNRAINTPLPQDQMYAGYNIGKY